MYNITVTSLYSNFLQTVLWVAEADGPGVLQLLPAGDVEGQLPQQLPGPLLHQVQGGNLAAPLGRDP